jgi:hypothetical protein
MIVGGTRSSLERSHKRRFFDEFLKMDAGPESNQKWSGVKLDSGGCGGGAFLFSLAPACGER